MIRRIINSNPFLIKLLHWEYWPMSVVYFPLSIYYIYLSARAGSFFFWSTSNPTIESGGMMFESKWSIFKLIPPQYFPKTIFVSENDTVEDTFIALENSGIKYPFIAKPDRGERGWAIKKIESAEQLNVYIQKSPVDFLIQSFVDMPVELSVFYYRLPDQERGTVSSVCFKELLKANGNGKSTLKELIMANPRALLRLDALKEQHAAEMDSVLLIGEEKLLVPLGNHCRGATFFDYNHIIDESLIDVFDHISKQIDGFYYGRYDLKCQSLEDLKAGKNIAIVELNGAGAEPAHIYQPDYPLLKGQKDIFFHYKKLWEVSMANARKGEKFMTIAEFRDLLRRQKAYKLKVNSAS